MDTQENKKEKKQFFQIQYFSENPKTEMGFRLSLAFLCILFIIAYVMYFSFEWNFFAELVSDKKDDWGTFGDYIGGTVGTVIALFLFLATLEIIHLQKKELKETRDELERSGNAQELQAKLFEQQQFETTFFSLISLLNEEIKSHPYNRSNGYNSGDDGLNTDKVYLLFKCIVDMIINYTNRQNERGEYLYFTILKSQFTTHSLDFIMKDIAENNDKILKELVEKYRFFEYMKYANYGSHYVQYFNQSAFGSNYHLLVKQIHLIKNSNKLAEYATNPYTEVRQAVAKNHETSIETLEQLSQDSEEEVRQAAINTINFLKSQNDENK